MVFDKLITSLFSPGIKGNKVRGLYNLRNRKLSLNLNDDILSQIVSTPKPFDDSQRDALQDRISAYNVAQRENSDNQRSLREEYATMQLSELISKCLTALSGAGEYKESTNLYFPFMFQVDYIQKAIQKISELRNAGERAIYHIGLRKL